MRDFDHAQAVRVALVLTHEKIPAIIIFFLVHLGLIHSTAFIGKTFTSRS